MKVKMDSVLELAEFYLFADKNRDARLSWDIPSTEESGKVLNLEELGKLVREYLVMMRIK